jgi:hypothetical protein
MDSASEKGNQKGNDIEFQGDRRKNLLGHLARLLK